jgi:iron complex outermembrane receptor protein
MRDLNPTRIIRETLKGTVFAGLALGLIPLANNTALAQGQSILEEIVVTATKREEALQDVPISVATMSGERLNSIFTGGEDVLALANRVPGLYAESSNGRAAPRFYLRGLGNIDFDLGASQPVSFIMDEVVMENVVLKSFPLFDVENIEVIRGPQGTLFGRNTTAGIIKVNTRRPSHESSGYIAGSLGTYTTGNLEAAYGGSLSPDTLAARVSFLYRTRDDWISNGFTGESDVMGEYEEIAGRVQLLWTPSDNFEALLNLQARSMDGTASIFRANVFTTGSNELNQNFDRDVVYYDGGDNNPQGYDSFGATLTLDWDVGNSTITSITSFQDADGSSRGDIDGGVSDTTGTATVPPGITSATNVLQYSDFSIMPLTFPGAIHIASVTEDGADTDQFTQEFRIASDTDGPLSWQVGAFYFDSELLIETDSFASYGFLGPPQNTIVKHENTAWAIFGQLSYDVSDRLNLTAGVRYTDDEKDYRVEQFGRLWIDFNATDFPFCCFSLDPMAINVSDDETSWEVSANFAATDSSSWYGRISSGFRAQTIQGRDVAFLETPTVAVPETITSYEIGYKADLADNRLRLNAAVFYYTVDDMQFSIIGGTGNAQQVINADEGEATGFELDLEWLATDNLMFTLGYAWNDTEIKDSALATTPCSWNNNPDPAGVPGMPPAGGFGVGCSPTQNLDSDTTKVLVNGMPFPRVPDWSANFSVRWGTPVGTDGEMFVFTDWIFQGESVMPLYESLEFDLDSQFEGGLKIGYRDLADNWERTKRTSRASSTSATSRGLSTNRLSGVSKAESISETEEK